MELETLSEAIEAVGESFEDFKKSSDDKLRNLELKSSQLRDEVTELAQRGTPLPHIPEPRGLLSKAIESDGMKAFQSRATKDAQIPMELSIKALVGDIDGSGNHLVPVQAQRGPQVGEDQRRSLRLLDVLPSLGVSSNSFEFVRLNSFANAADYQAAEGDTKAEQDIDPDLQSTGIKTIAVTIPVSEQVLADAPMLRQFLDSKLRFGVLDKLESELIAGDGIGVNINGLVAQATAATVTATAAADKIGEALTELEVAGWHGGLIILHPNDWQAIRAERGTSNDGYIAGGWSAPSGSQMWGVPVVTSNSVAENTGLVLDPAQLAVLDRQSVMVAVGYTGNQFSQNMVTLRAELRAGLAVFSPSAILKVTV